MGTILRGTKMPELQKQQQNQGNLLNQIAQKLGIPTGGNGVGSSGGSSGSGSSK